MRTGLSKKQKTTSVFFDEASPIIEVRQSTQPSAGWWTMTRMVVSHLRSGKGGSVSS